MSTRSPTGPHPTLVAILALLAPAGLSAQEFFVGGGSSFYETDAYCLDDDATVTDYHVTFGGDSFGASVTYDSGDWPWPKPPGTGPGGNQRTIGEVPTVIARQQAEPIYLSRGSAVQVAGEIYPFGFFPGLREATRSLRRYVKPFVGAGLQFSSEGEASDDRDRPTYAIQGSTDPMVVYGVGLRLPLTGSLGLQAQYRGTTLFGGAGELVGPGGEEDQVSGSTVSWGTVIVGFTLGL